MLDRLANNSNIKYPENLHIAMYEGIIANAICSQGFLFEREFNMKLRFKRKKKVLGICDYCGNNAFYRFKNGNLCCKSHFSKCPERRNNSHFKTIEFRKLQSERLKGNQYKKGFKHTQEFCGNQSKRMLALGDEHQMKDPEIVKKVLKTKEVTGVLKQYSESWKNEGNPSKRADVKIKQSETKKGDLNPAKRPEVRAKISKTLKGRFVGPLSSVWKGGNITIYCTQCGKSKQIIPAAKRKNNFCDRQCSFEWHVGENHSNHGKYGPEAPGWKGGVSFDPYCPIFFDEEYKQSIRDRDNNECQNPDCNNHYNAGHKLSVHHIDGNKMACDPWNLISLCKGCNNRAEGNKDIPREYWENFYQNIMAKKYGYQY